MGRIGDFYRGVKRGPENNPIYEFFLIGFGIFKWLALFVVCGFLILGFTVILNANSQGVTQLYAAQAETAITNSKILSPIYASLQDTLKVVKDPSLAVKDYGWKTEVIDNKENQELGLKFGTVNALPSRTTVDNEIILNVPVTISSLKEDSTLKFNCSSKDVSQEKIVINPSEEIKISKNQRYGFTLTCAFLKNAFPPLTTEEVKGKIVKLDAIYDFTTKSYLDIYTMPADTLRDLTTQGINPLENEENSLLDKQTRQTIAESTNGPMRTILSLQWQQPLTEKSLFSPSDQTYTLGLKIQKSNVWQGKLNKINSVKIFLPNNFELIDENFKDSTSSGNVLGGGNDYRVYELKQEKIDELNGQCKYYSSEPEKCNELFERGFIVALPKFKINSLDVGLTRDSIGAEIDYDFQAETQKTITLVKEFA